MSKPKMMCYMPDGIVLKDEAAWNYLENLAKRYVLGKPQDFPTLTLEYWDVRPFRSIWKSDCMTSEDKAVSPRDRAISAFMGAE